MGRRRSGLALLLLLALLGPGPRSAGESLAPVPLVEDLGIPWDLAFLSEHELLLTEKPGRLLRIDLESGARQRIEGVPAVAYRGQGGLFGVELDPAFERNRLVYLAFAHPVSGDAATTRLVRARLLEARLEDLVVLFTAEPPGTRSIHYGGALEWDDQGHLYLSVGDRGDRRNAQRLDNDLGKIHRLHADGRAPLDNPFVGKSGARATIFSLGHRNPQGLARHPESGEIWSTEHGPQGGDEVNVVRAGRNYGWPLITYGEEYAGGRIGDTHREGLEQPLHYWVPSIATAGMAFQKGEKGERVGAWRGNLFVAGLRKTLARIALQGERVLEVEHHLGALEERMRGVAQSPGGRLYVWSENGVLYRVELAPERP